MATAGCGASELLYNVGKGRGHSQAVGKQGLANGCFRWRGGENEQVTGKQGAVLVTEVEAKAGETGCNGQPMNDRMGGMRYSGVARVKLTMVEERGHGCRAGSSGQGGQVANEHGTGG